MWMKIFVMIVKLQKMRRNPHNKETPKASDTIEIIHSDIMGPVNKSVNGYRFILVIIDEYSRKFGYSF